MVAGPEQARILVVSASPYTRYVVSGELSSKPDLFVVGTARTPEEIAYKLTLLRPDLAVVDLELRRDLLDLQQTLLETELPVLVLCPHTDAGAELAFAALEAGAADIVARPTSEFEGANFAPDLLRKVRGLARVGHKQISAERCLAAWRWPNSVSPSKASPRGFMPGDSLVVVSATTGGLSPLIQLLITLPANLSASLLVLSWLPTRYLRWFLSCVNQSTAFHLRQARDGLSLKSGVAYFALNDNHLTVGRRGCLALDRSPRRNQIRPSADVTLSALATQYGPAVMGVILSGIGRDGVQGALDVYAAGGTVIVQEAATCLADETPVAVIESGAATVVLSPEQIADEIVRRALVEADH